jgi:hypothetical protein
MAVTRDSIIAGTRVSSVPGSLESLLPPSLSLSLPLWKWLKQWVPPFSCSGLLISSHRRSHLRYSEIKKFLFNCAPPPPPHCPFLFDPMLKSAGKLLVLTHASSGPVVLSAPSALPSHPVYIILTVLYKSKNRVLNFSAMSSYSWRVSLKHIPSVYFPTSIKFFFSDLLWRLRYLPKVAKCRFVDSRAFRQNPDFSPLALVPLRPLT